MDYSALWLGYFYNENFETLLWIDSCIFKCRDQMPMKWKKTHVIEKQKSTRISNVEFLLWLKTT